jgi:hypothetical protein
MLSFFERTCGAKRSSFFIPKGVESTYPRQKYQSWKKDEKCQFSCSGGSTKGEREARWTDGFPSPFRVMREQDIAQHQVVILGTGSCAEPL